MTNRRRLDRLAIEHPCPSCAGTGVAARAASTAAALPPEATRVMLDLAERIADEFDDEATATAQA